MLEFRVGLAFLIMVFMGLAAFRNLHSIPAPVWIAICLVSLGFGIEEIGMVISDRELPAREAVLRGARGSFYLGTAAIALGASIIRWRTVKAEAARANGIPEADRDR